MRPASSVRKSLSSVTTWETLATESFGSQEALAGTSTLPGASTSRRFAVKTTAMTVRVRLRLKASSEMIRTGRRNPGPDSPPRRTRGSDARLSCGPGAWWGTRPEPRHTGDSETRRAAFPTFRLNQTGLPESTPLCQRERREAGAGSSWVDVREGALWQPPDGPNVSYRRSPGLKQTANIYPRKLIFLRPHGTNDRRRGHTCAGAARAGRSQLSGRRP